MAWCPACPPRRPVDDSHGRPAAGPLGLQLTRGWHLPEAFRSQITTRLQAHANNRFPGRFDRLE